MYIRFMVKAYENTEKAKNYLYQKHFQMLLFVSVAYEFY